MGGEHDNSTPGFKVNDRRVSAEDSPESPPQDAPANRASTSTTQAEHDAIPPVDFATFVLSLGTSCLMQLGDAHLPGTDAQVDLPMARHTLDLLAMLEQKTQGNLTGEEERLLSQLLYDLRMRYVAKSKS